MEFWPEGAHHASSHPALSKRGCSQANWIALSKSCRYNNSSGDHLAHYLMLAGGVKLAGGLESFTHRCDRLGFESSRRYG
jgi:hypothetical protein